MPTIDSHLTALETEPPRTPGKPVRLRDLHGLPPVLARSGPLDLRLATRPKDVRRAQRLRFQVFYVEGDAIPTPRDALARRDRCGFDAVCDHLLVVDRTRAGRDEVVGTYRLLRGEVAAAHSGFYSGSEFDLQPMLDRHPTKRFLELGRSCVQADYRGKRVIEMLWRGIGLYATHHRIDVLIGCASLPGTDLSALARPLAALRQIASVDPAWHVDPLPGRSPALARVEPGSLDLRRTIATLPPLVKAYARAGGRFAPEPVIDHQFGTTDLFAVLPFADADLRYMAYFGGVALMGDPSSAGH